MLLNLFHFSHYPFMRHNFPPLGYLPNPRNTTIFHRPHYRPIILAISAVSALSNSSRWAKISSLRRGATYL